MGLHQFQGVLTPSVTIIDGRPLYTQHSPQSQPLRAIKLERTKTSTPLSLSPSLFFFNEIIACLLHQPNKH